MKTTRLPPPLPPPVRRRPPPVADARPVIFSIPVGPVLARESGFVGYRPSRPATPPTPPTPRDHAAGDTLRAQTLSSGDHEEEEVRPRKWRLPMLGSVAVACGLAVGVLGGVYLSHKDRARDAAPAAAALDTPTVTVATLQAPAATPQVHTLPTVTIVGADPIAVAPPQAVRVIPKAPKAPIPPVITPAVMTAAATAGSAQAVGASDEDPSGIALPASNEPEKPPPE